MIGEMNKSGSGQITFGEWRDFLLLLPRQASLPAVISYWQSFSRHRLGTSMATQDLDVIVAEKPILPASTSSFSAGYVSSKGKGRAKNQDENHSNNAEKVDYTNPEQSRDEQGNGIFEGSGAYLLAGGLAGAVSRTATAPFDRLKVYLINAVDRPGIPLPSLSSTATQPIQAVKAIAETGSKGMGAFASAMKSLYAEGGVRAFFVGNGLNVIKVRFFGTKYH